MKKSFGPKTLLYALPVWVIGTYDKDGKPNVMTASWGGMCCSKPPCAAVSLREVTYTYRNIMERKAFTINVPSEAYIKEADYFGIASGKDEDKFAVSGLTPVKSDVVDAPYVEEFPLIVECNLLKTVEIGLHTQFIGEIMDVKLDTKACNMGVIDLSQIKPFIYDPANMSYMAIGNNLGKAFSMGKELKK
ncbi:MAG: flavin reductase family protein [Planctomycetota bacterium]